MYQKRCQRGKISIYLAFDLNYITKTEFEELFLDISEFSKLISGFIKYLQK